MDAKQNPFSVYDFLGYLIPGAFLIYVILLAAKLLGCDVTVWLAAQGKIFTAPSVYIPFAICAYISGHVLSFVSSLTVERYAIWAYGYPSQFLIDRRPEHYLRGIPQDQFEVSRRRIRRFICFFGFPYTSLDSFLEKRLLIREMYAKRLDEHTRMLVQRKLWLFLGNNLGIFRHQILAKGQVDCVVDLSNQDYFRAIYHYVIEHYPSHVPSLKNYVALYGFLRTITLLFVTLFWLFFLISAKSLSVDVYEYLTGAPGVSWRAAGLWILAALVVWPVCYIFFLAFVKFFRRFSLEAFMALAANYNPDLHDSIKDQYAENTVSSQNENPKQ